jgi:hypothetical protein
VTLNQQSVNCDWCANSLQILVSIILHSDPVCFNSSIAATWCCSEDLPTQHTYSSLHICAVHTPHNKSKKLPFYKEWHCHLVDIKNHYIIFSTVPAKACQLQMLLFSLTTDRILINIKIISYTIMSNFYSKCFLE